MPRLRLKTIQKKSLRIFHHLRRALRKARQYSLKRRKLLAVIFVLAGICLIILPQAVKNFSLPSAQPAAQNVTPSSRTAIGAPQTYGPIKIDDRLLGGQPIAQPPTRIIIPGLSIDLPIVEAKVVNGYWEVFETTASHGLGSAYPGQLGNTVIFAHTQAGLFLLLRDIKVGNVVYVLTNDRWHRYKTTDVKTVAPNQVEVIAPTNDETLTLFTCSGFLDSKRLVVVAKPER